MRPAAATIFSTCLLYSTTKDLEMYFNATSTTYYNGKIVNFTSQNGHVRTYAGHTYSHNITYFIPDSAPKGLYTFQQTHESTKSAKTYINITFVTAIS